MIKLLTLIKTNWVAFTLCTIVAIMVLSLWPLEKLPSMPGTDKSHHLIAYAFLIFPTALRKPNKWILLSLLFISFGGAIELLQPYVNRYGDWLDMAANTAGVACGLIMAELANHFFPSISNRPR